MKLDIAPAEPRMRALRVQLVELEDGVLVKRGRVELKVAGPRAAGVLQVVLLAALDGATRSELCAPFAAPDRPAVERLVAELEARRILVPAEERPGEVPSWEESANDVFVWHFGESVDGLADRLAARRITVMGVNAISRQLVASLTAGGLRNVEVVDYPLLANLRMFDDRGVPDPAHWPPAPAPLPYEQWREGVDPDEPAVLVATTDFGGLQVLRWWNERASRNGWHFLPVALRDLVGYVGPLVVPGETACYECLRARQNSHLDDPELRRAAESVAFEGQAATGFHPAMASILGDLAALELVKSYSGWPVPRLVGSLIEVNLLAGTMTARKVLRVPRCGVCGSHRRHSGVSLDKQVLMPGHEVYA
jgi:bacteriocin biosynthesis cyclodehydratase domain-containing protein